MTALTKPMLLTVHICTLKEGANSVIFKNKNRLCSSSVVEFLLIKLLFVINTSCAPLLAFQKTGTYPFHLAGI